MRDCDLGMAVRIYVAKINRVVLARRDRWITGGTGAVWHGANHPGQTVVGGDGNAGATGTCCILASLVRNVSSAIGRNTNVAMQTAAGSRSHRKIHAVDGGESVNRNAGTKGDAAIITA